MIVFAFTAAMLLIALAAYAANQTIVVVLTFGLLMTGLFIFQFQSYPVVREWMEKYF